MEAFDCRNLYIKPNSANLGFSQFLELGFADSDVISFCHFPCLSAKAYGWESNLQDFPIHGEEASNNFVFWGYFGFRLLTEFSTPDGALQDQCSKSCCVAL